MSDTITSDDILGKEAVDPDGAILGTVVKLHISNKDKQVVGLTVDMGFMKPDLFVGIKHVKHFGEDAVLLKIVPGDRLKGLQVLTYEGVNVGLVSDTKMARKHVKEITVRTKEGLLNKEQIKISASNIDRIGGSIVLKKGYKINK